jgi:hypothetical protein
LYSGHLLYAGRIVVSPMPSTVLAQSRPVLSGMFEARDRNRAQGLALLGSRRWAILGKHL